MSAGLMPRGEILAGDRFARIPPDIRAAKVRGWLRSELRIEVPDEFVPLLPPCESGSEARFL